MRTRTLLPMLAALAAGFAASFFLARTHETAAVSPRAADVAAAPVTVLPSRIASENAPTTHARHDLPLRRVEMPAEMLQQYHPRDPAEWQGMLVNTAIQPPCETSGQCGMAAACAKGKCGPCKFADDCDMGEACVLDHCLKRENASCESRRDCPSGDYCILSGYSSDPRGNSDMRASCVSSLGGSPRKAPPERREEAPENAAPQMADQLFDELRKSR